MVSAKKAQMGKANNRPGKLTESPSFWLFLSVSLLFGILFFRFIFGEYAYVYEDIGSDTFHINYPLYMMFSDFVHQGGYSDYVLRAGLGMDISSYFYQYLNPLNLLVLILPQRYLPWSILLATYLKLLLLAFAAWQLFRRLLSHEWAGLYAALFWTFSGYVMLWGQHYGFCMSLMLFTVFMLLVYLYTEEEEKSRNWLLVLWITLMLFSNYYFLYTSGIVGAAFVVLYLFWKKERPGKILAKLAGLGLMGLLGICIGGVCLIPTMNIFLSSARTGSAVNSFALMFSPYRIRAWVIYLGRFFSNNTFGAGNDYGGLLNYYEAIMLSVSALALPGVLYLIGKKQTRKKASFLTILAFVMMAFPVTGQVLNISLWSYRWSFVICFLEAFAIGYFIRDKMEGADPVLFRNSMVLSAVLMLIAFVILAIGSGICRFGLQPVYLILCAAAFVIYALVLWLKEKRFRNNRKAFSLLLLGAVVAELAVANFPTINFRMPLTRHQVNMQRYHDGVGETYEALKEQDSSVYRVGRNDGSYINDGMAQGYPGFSVYMSTNSKEAIELKESFGGTGFSANKLIFDESNSAMRALLGLKYLIADPDISLPSEDFTYVTHVGSRDIYAYDRTLPFGYLYDQKWDTENIRNMNDFGRVRAIVSGFYFTEAASDTDYETPQKLKGEKTAVLDFDFEGFHCEVERTSEGVHLYHFETDPYDPYVVWHDLDTALDDGIQHELIIKADPESLDGQVSMAYYYTTDEDADFSYDRMKSFSFTPDSCTFHIFIPAGVKDIRIDVDSKTDGLTISEMTIVNYPDLEQPFRKLQESKVTDTIFTDHTYQAKVDNTESHVQMLCVPLIYSRGWRAELDQESVPLYNINDGLCGIEIPSGIHEVKLHYDIPHRSAGTALTITGTVVYLICFLLLPLYRKKRKNQGL